MINLTKEISEDKSRNLAKAIATDELCAKILISRGIEEIQAAKKFLYGSLDDLCSPFLYADMAKAAAEINDVINTNGRIVIYGDYDCDGVGAVSIMIRALRDKGIDCNYYIPNRAEEGYGLNFEAIKKIQNTYHPDLMITVDCGINAFEEIENAIALGIKIIVTDHHRLDGKLPPCTVVNPCRNPELTQLCGAGIAYYLVRALFGDVYAYNYLDICTLSTVADVVPLVEDNRILVRCGLQKIKTGCAQVGIKALMANIGIASKRICSYDIAFKIAPRLNASGRIKDANSSVKLLTTEDVTEAAFLSEELSMQNTERQELESHIVAHAMDMLKDYDFGKYRVIVLYNPEWQEGVNGIAAARLVEYFNLPVILLTKSSDGLLKGSARSINGINIYDALAMVKDVLVRFGGHAMAAGISLQSNDLDTFRNELNKVIFSFPKELFIRETRVDAEFSVDDLSDNFFSHLKLLQPYGYKNPTPIFYDNATRLKFNIMKGKHLKARSDFGTAVCFGKSGILPAYNSAKSKGIVYSLETNYFNGKEYNQIKVKDVVFDGYEISDIECFKKFAEFSIEIKERDHEKHSFKSDEGPILDVFFNFSAFQTFTEENIEVKKIYHEIDTFELGNSAVLSPSVDFPFFYFNRIRVHGEITDSIKKYFHALNAQFIGEEKIALPCLDIIEMRLTYKVLRNALLNSEIKNVEELYQKAKEYGYNIDYDRFIVHYYILFDVGLLKKVNGDILKINNEKTDITKSELYRYING